MRKIYADAITRVCPAEPADALLARFLGPDDDWPLECFAAGLVAVSGGLLVGLSHEAAVAVATREESALADVLYLQAATGWPRSIFLGAAGRDAYHTRACADRLGRRDALREPVQASAQHLESVVAGLEARWPGDWSDDWRDVAYAVAGCIEFDGICEAVAQSIGQTAIEARLDRRYRAVWRTHAWHGVAPVWEAVADAAGFSRLAVARAVEAYWPALGRRIGRRVLVARQPSARWEVAAC
ncbi:MAG: hypothetical protein QM766_24080 [Burkholderiaceae bacterium]